MEVDPETRAARERMAMRMMGEEDDDDYETAVYDDDNDAARVGAISGVDAEKKAEAVGDMWARQFRKSEEEDGDQEAEEEEEGDGEAETGNPAELWEQWAKSLEAEGASGAGESFMDAIERAKNKMKQEPTYEFNPNNEYRNQVCMMVNTSN